MPNAESNSRFDTQHRSTERKSPPSDHSLKQSPIQFSHESGQYLQNEVDRLKAELQRLKSSSHKPMILFIYDRKTRPKEFAEIGVCVEIL